MRWLTLVLVITLTACSGGEFSAEVVDINLQPKVVGPVRWHGACTEPEGCLYRYRVHVTNTGDRTINVGQCTLTVTDGDGATYSSVGAAGSFPAGTSVKPGHEAVLDARAAFLISGRQNRRVDVVSISCEAWDWHGTAPI
jgi:hypothetical protein